MTLTPQQILKNAITAFSNNKMAMEDHCSPTRIRLLEDAIDDIRDLLEWMGPEAAVNPNEIILTARQQ